MVLKPADRIFPASLGKVTRGQGDEKQFGFPALVHNSNLCDLRLAERLLAEALERWGGNKKGEGWKN